MLRLIPPARQHQTCFHDHAHSKPIEGTPPPVPCPFCGDTDSISLEAVGDEPLGVSYHVNCQNCFCEGPPAATALEAAKKWNRGPTSTPAGSAPMSDESPLSPADTQSPHEASVEIRNDLRHAESDTNSFDCNSALSDHERSEACRVIDRISALVSVSHDLTLANAGLDPDLNNAWTLLHMARGKLDKMRDAIEVGTICQANICDDVGGADTEIESEDRATQ